MYEKPRYGGEINQQQHVNDALALALVLNEGGGDQVQDATANKNTGTLTPTVFANLDGNSQFFYAIDTDFPESGLTGAQDFTIYVWANFNVVTGQQNMMSKWETDDNNRMYRFETFGGEIFLTLSPDGSSGSIRLSTNAGLVAGEWVHLAVTYDASGGSCIFYKNGVALTDDGGALPNTIADKTPDFKVGAYNSTPANFFNGGLHNVCLFDDIRTPSEVATSAVSWDEDNSAAGNIIGQWMFDESGSAAAIDNTQGDAGRDLTPFDGGDVTFANCGRDLQYIGWQGGIHSPALFLNGNAQYVDLPDADAYDFDSDDQFSVAVWVKSNLTTDSVFRTIVGKYSAGAVGWRLGMAGDVANDPLQFQINDGVNTDYIQVDGDLLGDNKWHFLVATYDGSNSPGGMNIYLDGIALSVDNTNDDAVGTTTNTADLLIGTDDSIIDYINGEINWLSIWHRIITPIEVEELRIEPFLPFNFVSEGAVKFGGWKWENFREGMAPPRLTPLADVIFRFTYGGTDYDTLLQGSRVRRNASLGAGEAKIVLDNTDGAWNTFHADRNNLGDEGSVTMLLDDGLATHTILLFTGDAMEVEYDENRMIIKLRDKVWRFLKQRIGSGQNPTTVDGFGVGHLAWHLLTNIPPNGAGLDSTEDASNPDIDYTAHQAWTDMLNGQGYEVGAKITGHTVKWCLDRLAKMTNTYIWQGGDGRVTFAPPRKNGLVYRVDNTDNIGLSLITDTIVNDITVYYNYDTDEGTWEDHVHTAGTIATNSRAQYGRISEVDDGNIIFHNTEASAANQITEQIKTYASPIRMWGINAFLPAFEDDLTYLINVTKAVYGITGQSGIIEEITYDLTTAEVAISARWAW